MCTVSWLYSATGYQLFFNRDELLTRQRALRPSIKEHHQVRFIAPTDSDAGGTWISVNQFGTSLCLLNNYGAQAKQSGIHWISRGQLVHELAHFADIADVQNHVESTELGHYRPFDLLALSLTRHIRLLSWDGVMLRVSNTPTMPITSSSFNTEKVIASRLRQFAHYTSSDNPHPEELANYHASHLPDSGPYSVCMHRDNGQTVSFSHISVQADEATFHYYDGPPCQTTDPQTNRLQLLANSQPDVA